MVLNFFKQSHPLILILTPALGLIPFLFIGDDIKFIIAEPESPIIIWAIGLIAEYKYLLYGLPILFLIAQFFILLRLNTRHIFIESRSYLEGTIFFILIIGMGSYKMLSGAMIAGFFLLFALNTLFRLEKELNLKIIFETTMLVALGSLFYWGLIYYIPIIWISFSILKSFSIREHLVSLLGVAAPYIFFVLWYFLNDNMTGFYFWIENNVKLMVIKPQFEINKIAYLGMIAFFLLISMLAAFKSLKTKKIVKRKYFLIFFIISFFSIALFVVNSYDYGYLLLAAPWLSYIFSNYFLNLRSRFIGEILFLLMIAASIFTMIQV